MEALAKRLVPVVAMALDLRTGYFAEAFAEPNCAIRLIHYPPHPHPEDNEFGFAQHTDNNFLTFLAQSAVPGLEVRTGESEWIRPPAIPGTFIVNTGAMLVGATRVQAFFKLWPCRCCGRACCVRRDFRLHHLIFGHQPSVVLVGAGIHQSACAHLLANSVAGRSNHRRRLVAADRHHRNVDPGR
jgi:hypothetical protein